MAPKESAADTRRYFLQTAFLQKAVEASKIKVSKKEAEKQLKSRMVLYESAREQNILEH